MGWLINGVKHTGQIITVGPSGRDFTHPQDAYVVADAGALLLCDPGTYNLKLDSNSYQGLYIFGAWYKSVYIRGLGASADDTVFANNISTTRTSFCFQYGIVENIKIAHNVAADWTSAVGYGSPDKAMTFSKCNIVVGGNKYPLVALWQTQSTGYVKFRYCKLVRGYVHMSGQNFAEYAIDLSTIYVDKCETNGTLNYNFYKNSLAQNDHRPMPTAGYGYGYGDFIIQEVQRRIAIKESHYRRLRA